MTPKTATDWADRSEHIADESRQKWVATLAIGNGAALFAVFSLAFENGELAYPGPSLIAAWLFFIGVVMASVSQLCAAAEMRFHELYWRFVGIREQWRSAGNNERAESFQQKIDLNDRKGDEAGRISGWCALLSGSAFIFGVAVPLVAITRSHLGA